MDFARPTLGRPWNPLRALNGEAGDHAICGDPREVKAALRAGERSWRRFPYYEQRYGDRGLRFTRSDSAWLVSLAGSGAAIVEQQILWLGLVLASRGMPRWLLELHLGALHEELNAAIPGREELYGALRDAAEMLREQRLAHIEEVVFTAESIAFAREVGEEWDARLPETGALLVAAVADEKAGLTRAVPSFVSWMADPSRFPRPWIDAIHATLARARKRAV